VHLSHEKLTYLTKQFQSFHRFPISLLPTPCHRLDRLSKAAGVDVFCKRDDLTGFGLGGNKTRKLEFLMGEAEEHCCDTVVTAGGTQSNFCRLTAVAGAAAGMKVHLILGGDRPAKPTGNLILDHLVGARIHYVDSEDWKDWEEESERVAKGVESDGGTVFRIPIGGSVPVGAMGYVRALVEIIQDQERLGTGFDTIVHASGSGGTQAGLLAGKAMTGWPGRVMGVSVAMDGPELSEKVYTLSRQTTAILGGQMEEEWVWVEPDFVGGGYGERTRGGEQAIREFATQEGIFLDHVYTAKAAAALLQRLKEGMFRGQTVLFLHTGGQPELFAEY
jgi:D-cysteine desulfhydrase family pyridoxal phosphate-dependent enzyme